MSPTEGVLRVRVLGPVECGVERWVSHPVLRYKVPSRCGVLVTLWRTWTGLMWCGPDGERHECVHKVRA